LPGDRPDFTSGTLRAAYSCSPLDGIHYGIEDRHTEMVDVEARSLQFHGQEHILHSDYLLGIIVFHSISSSLASALVLKVSALTSPSIICILTHLHYYGGIPLYYLAWSIWSISFVVCCGPAS